MKMKLYFAVLIATFSSSAIYAETCPQTHDGFPFHHVQLTPNNVMVFCEYKFAKHSYIVKPIFKNSSIRYRYTYGPWKNKGSATYYCRSHQSADCGFEEIS